MATVTIGLTGSNNTQVQSWSTWRGMKQGAVQLKMNHFICQNYKPGCWTHWHDLPTSFTLGLRNSAGVQVGSVTWTQAEFGVTKTIWLPASGNYAVNTRFSPFAGYHSLPASHSCYETYFYPDFNVSATFTPNV